jgi:hypothetical protein
MNIFFSEEDGDEILGGETIIEGATLAFTWSFPEFNVFGPPSESLRSAQKSCAATQDLTGQKTCLDARFYSAYKEYNPRHDLRGPFG